jgi:hypothetical protein
LQETKEFTSGRRELIYALERIVVWREHFQGAARILLQLAEGENERWANNATGIFIGLVLTGARSRRANRGTGRPSGFPVLKEALNSPSVERRRIALKALGAALHYRSFS